MTLVSSKGRMFLYLFLALFSGLVPSDLVRECLHSCNNVCDKEVPISRNLYVQYQVNSLVPSSDFIK